MNPKENALNNAKTNAQGKAIKSFSFSGNLKKAAKVPTQKELDTYGFNNAVKNKISVQRKLKNRI
jgi:hypothetical protein